MRKIYFILGMLFFTSVSWGQLLTEDFNYTAGTLLTTNGWTAHSGGGTNAITVTSPGLTYTGHPGSGVGNAITMTTSGEDDNRALSSAINSGSAYVSFMVNISAAQATGDYFIGLLQNNTSFPLRIYARLSGAGFVFGVGKQAGTASYESTVRTFGTTYFIVANYIYNAAAQDDAVNLWVDPSLGGAEPAATIANVIAANADAATIIAAYVRQGGAGSASTQQVDAILAGTTWSSVTPLAGGTTATLANLAPQPSGSITQGTANAVLAGFSITPSASVDFSSITVTSTGTATGTDITNVRIFKDNDGNGAINGADAAVGGASPQAYSASMVFSGITSETGLTAQSNYLVVADIAGVGVSTPGVTTTVSSNTFTTTATSNNGSFAGNSRTIAAPPGATTITAGPGAEPATISSLVNTQGASVLNFDFTITDDGATPSTDAVASQISQIILNAGTGNSVTNWTTAILGVELSDGTNSTTTATIGTGSITFAGISNNVGELGHIADDAAKTYTLKIWLNTNLGALRNVIDGQNFVFRVQTADVTMSGSQLATGQDVNSGPANNVVDVTGTALAFVAQPANTNVGLPMTNVTVSVNDANGNRDLGSTISIDITSTGTLTGSPVTVAAVSGLATFAGLTHTATGTGLALNAERNGTGDWDVVSNTFNITSVPIAAWDFTGLNTVATATATTFSGNLVSTSGANDITRGATATASAGANSFRTQGFQNDPIATSNTDYFQVTLTAQPGFELSLSGIDGNMAGTASFAASPGVSSQFAYSLDGTNFTLIGSPTVTIGSPAALPLIDLSGVPALQNVSAGTTVTLRYYASGQTTSGGWGFNSPSAGVNGLGIYGSLAVSSTPNLSVSSGSLTFGQQAVGSNSTSQSVDLSGVNLTGAPGNITVTSPSTDFEVSNDNSTWGPSTTIPYAGATLSATPVYVRFTPQSAGAKSGNVTFSGGGDVTPPTVAVSGTGTITYYSKAAGNLTDVATWGPNTDGTGSSPANFTADGQVFTVANRAAATLDADWVVSGAGSKVVVGDGLGVTDLTIPSTFTLTGTVDISATGELTLENTTIAHTYGTVAAGSTIEFAQAGSYTVPNTITYQNLKLTGGTKTLSGNTTTVNGNLVFDNITLGAPGASPFATIDLNGNLTYSGTVVNPADANSVTLIMNGGTLQTIFGGGSNTARFFRITATLNTSVSLSSDVLVGNAAGGGIEIEAGSQVYVNTNTITTFAGPARINGFVTSTGVFRTSGGGNFNIQTSSNSNSSLYFDNINNQIGSLTVNATGTGVVVIGSNAEVTNLTMTAGKMQIAEGITLNLGTAANLVGTFDNTRYIITAANTTTGAKGFFRAGNIPVGNFTFPVGTATSYLPVTVNPTATSDFSVNTFTGITSDGQPNGAAFTAGQKASVVDAVWIVDRNGGTGDVTMTTSWPAALEGANFAALADAQIGIARHDGSVWGTVAGTGDNTANTATRSAISSFSPFGVGQVGQVLPVNFGTVKATQLSSGSIKVDWSNLTELDVVSYTVERSADGRSFTSIGTVNARLNNGGKADYSLIDANPFNGVNFYRIRSLEVDAKTKYSIIVRVDTRGGATQLVLYPNPVTGGQLSYSAVNLAKGQYALRIFNAAGQLMYNQAISHPGGSVTEAIPMPLVKAGVYTLQLNSADVNLSRTFVVQ
ncbi:MAG: T9SS type A sorting domain-containing protein [Chitinophagaceae bacterium]|nr:T9SS type A sorting domain-containing protein [Chitinophagaceae bacterium]